MNSLTEFTVLPTARLALLYSTRASGTRDELIHTGTPVYRRDKGNKDINIIPVLQLFPDPRSFPIEVFNLNIL
jgi:hypothetical protein